jgi:hypothetical protein
MLLTWKTAPVNSFHNRDAAGVFLCRWCTLVVMRSTFLLAVFFLPLNTILAAPQNAAAPAPQSASTTGSEYSGMYSFLKEGEFVQITIEQNGKVSGFISRFGDSAADKGSFLDQFVKSGKSDGAKLNFTTESVHGVWFTFDGVFNRGSGKKSDDEGYYVLSGTLTRFSADTDNKPTSQARQVEFTSFPKDAEPK